MMGRFKVIIRINELNKDKIDTEFYYTATDDGLLRDAAKYGAYLSKLYIERTTELEILFKQYEMLLKQRAMKAKVKARR